MPTYLLELYAPGHAAADLDDLAGRAGRVAEALSGEGTAIRHARSILVSEEETCFHVFEAETRHAALEAARQLGIPADRVLTAVAFEPVAPSRSEQVGVHRQDPSVQRREAS